MDIIALVFSILGVVIGAARLVIEIIKIKKENKKRNNRQDTTRNG